MAPKAIHLKRGVQNIYISVDQLFEAAFGSTPREYQNKSLLGWRPLAPDFAPPPYWTKHKPLGATDVSAAKAPGVKVFETDEMIVVEVELPPIVEESLYLEISGDLLIIRGNRVPARARNNHRSPKQTGKKVYRYVQLPITAKPGEVRARLEGNTVRVMIRKQNEK
jgi:HSP20 family molecular chaperone IbpA